MRRYCIFLFTCSIFATAASAQAKSIIDSLENIALRQKDTTLIKTYNELTWQYRNVNPAKAIWYGLKAVELGQRFKFDKGIAQAYNDMGIVYYFRQSFDSALYYYNKALEIRKRNADISGTAKLYNKIGIVHQQAGHYDKALEVQLMALQLFEQVKDDIGISYSLNNIGILHQNMDRYNEAIAYHEQSIAIKEKLHDRYGLAGSYVNVGNIYMLQKDYAKAKEYYNKGVAITRQIADKEYLSGALNSLGKLLTETGQLAEALPNVKESFELRQAMGDKKGMVKSMINLGDLYRELNQNSEAEAALAKAYDIAKAEESCKPEMPAIFKSFSELYEKNGNADKALQNYKLSVKLKDTIFTEGMSAKFAELQTKYETEKKNNQIALLGKDNSIKTLQIQNQKFQLDQQKYKLTQNQLDLSEAALHIVNNELSLKGQEQEILSQKLQASEKEKNIANLQKQSRIQQLEISNHQLALNRRNVLIASLLGAFVLLSLLGYSYYRRKQLQQETKLQMALLKQQQEATKAVMEAEEAERQRIAKDLHDGVGQMMSAAKMNLSAYEYGIDFKTTEEKQSFKKIIELVDESCTEVRLVSHNMMPNALVKNNLDAAIREFTRKLSQKGLAIHIYTEGLEKRLDANTETVLYRIIQECVNNVIKHANATSLDLSIIREEKELTATIEDNGKGFTISDLKNVDGIGLKNIRSRIEYLKGTVDFDSAPNRGTLVALHIPV